MRKIVVIKDEAAGNDSVGEMWQETKIFDETATLAEVMTWALGDKRWRVSKKHISLTAPLNNAGEVRLDNADNKSSRD